MEIVESVHNPGQHAWLKWVGLQEPPVEADSWVPVVRGLGIDDVKTETSSMATRLIDLLKEAGIQGAQRTYELDPTRHVAYFGVGGLAAVTHVAVLVHSRDHERAVQIATQVNSILDQNSVFPETPISDEVLTRQALEAGTPPED